MAFGDDPFDLDEAPPNPDVVDLDDEDDSSDDEPTRKEKRAARARRWQETRDARLSELEQKLHGVEERTAQQVIQGLRQQLQPQGHPGQQQGSNYDQQIAALDGYRDNLVRMFTAETSAKTMTEDKSRQIEHQLKLVENRKSELIAEKVAERRMAHMPQPYNPLVDEARRVTQEYQDVYGDARSRSAADGYYHLQISKGREDSAELRREALQYARRAKSGGVFDAREGSAFRGMGAGGGAAGGGAGPNRIEMTAERKKAADSMYPQIRDPQERYRTWARTCGKKALERERERGRG